MAEATSPQRTIKGELFRLAPSTDGVISKTDAEVENYALRYTYAPIWEYQVPVGQEFIITPEHRLGAYIEDDETSPAEWRDDQKVRVEVWDAGKRKMQIVYQGMYMESKEMQDLTKMATLDLLTAPLLLKSGDWIVISGHSWRAIYTIDVSDSFFSLEVTRVRPGLYA